MSILSGILKTFVGDKSKKDLKGLHPLVAKIHQAETGLPQLSNDELRAKTIDFKNQIAQVRQPFYHEFYLLKEEFEGLQDLDEKEDRYTSIDQATKQAQEEVAKALRHITP